MPSSTSTAWVRWAGTAIDRPSIAAEPTASMAPVIRPPGNPATRNNRPPIVPIASVSRNWRVLVRVGRASANHGGIWLTAPYGKSAISGQMRRDDRCNALWSGSGRGSGSVRRLGPARKTKRAVSHPRWQPGGWNQPKWRYYFLSLAAFLHSERNFLRSLPCSPLASASLEHSIDSALWAFAGLAIGAGAAVSDLAAGAAVDWAKTGVAKSRSDAPRAAARRDEFVMRNTSEVEEGATVTP